MIRFVKRLYKSDPVLVTVVMLLMLFSLLLIYSSTGRLAQVERGGNMWYYFLRHLALSVLALVAMGYKVSSRTARAIQRNPVSGKKKKN